MTQTHGEARLYEPPTALLTGGEQVLLLLYRAATYVTFHVIDDAALLAFGLS